MFGSTSIRSTVVTGQKACVCALMRATEGLKGKNKVFIKPLALGRRNGWMGGWVDGWVGCKS